jgi:hypothetical protein
MMGWLEGIAGPLVDPRALLDALLGRLRALPVHMTWGRELYTDPEPELADKIEALFDDAPIDRDPHEIMRVWEEEVTGPSVKADSLAAALVHALRLPWHEAYPHLAGAVLTLLKTR